MNPTRWHFTPSQHDPVDQFRSRFRLSSVARA